MRARTRWGIAMTMGFVFVVGLAAGVASSSFRAKVDAPEPTPSSTGDSSAVTATVTTATIRSASSATVYRGGLFVEPWGAAANAAETLRREGERSEAQAAETIASQPVAVWLSSYYNDDELDDLIDRDLRAAERTGTTPVFVTYNIPNRDCGGKSAGGAAGPSDYLSWNQRIADRLQGHRSVVLVEPDSLGQISSCPDQTEGRTGLLKAAVTEFARAGVPTYLDGGNSSWIDDEVMSKRLLAAGVDEARGFFTNVANYQQDEDERRYAERLADRLGDDVHYVIDTGRNGQGWQGTWCNAVGAGLGRTPVIATAGFRLDAFLWVKTPGASDGRCTGGPGPGKWFAAYAESLVQNRAG